MDTSDKYISFDEEGQCNHCNAAIKLSHDLLHPGEKGIEFLQRLASKIKQEGKNNEFDCMIGISGGVDSSYLAYLAVNLGMRPLMVHIDCGWNSELAVKNIENTIKKLNLELHTLVVNWEEMKDLHRSFFKASLPDQDIPQDHAIFAGLYRFAVDNNIRYVFNGVNLATESIMPDSWGYQAMDLKHLRSVHRQYGERKLRDYPVITFFQRYVYMNLIRRIKIINPLNYLDYRKDDAINTLTKELDWQYYGGKHYESRFTKFFQGYYLPSKFNFNKKRAHLSSLIISGQISRDQALIEMQKDLYTESEINDDLGYVAKKLGWTSEEFREIINLPPRSHNEFSTNEHLFYSGVRIKRFLSRILK